MFDATRAVQAQSTRTSDASGAETPVSAESIQMVTVRAERDGDGWVCQVGVDHAGERTQHTVNVTQAELARWGRGDQREDVEQLVQRSFDFLLQREAPAAILHRFDLSAIQHYFPEFDREFSR
jgi:hypothetical protein